MIEVRTKADSDSVLFELFDSAIGDVRLGELALHLSGYVLSLNVLKVMRGRGYGKALINACIDYADGQGISPLFLDVSETATPAIHLYESVGFKKIGKEMGFIQMERQ